jgi:hypothetical protein
MPLGPHSEASAETQEPSERRSFWSGLFGRLGMQRRAELRQLVWRAIEEEWDRTRPPNGGVGETLSKSIYDRLIAEWADVPPGAMDEILQNLHDRPLIIGSLFLDRESIRMHGARVIIEPERRF